MIDSSRPAGGIFGTLDKGPGWIAVFSDRSTLSRRPLRGQEREGRPSRPPLLGADGGPYRPPSGR